MTATTPSLRSAVVATVALLFAGRHVSAGDAIAPVAAMPSVHGDEWTAHGGVCPLRQPIGDDPDGYGFGVTSRAHALPSLLAPQQAWVCEYVPRPPRSRDSRAMRWLRDGPPRPVPSGEVPRLGREAMGVTVIHGGVACSADLGSRWMLVTSHDGDLTSVVVDGFGCGDTAVTDDPFTTPAGEASSAGMVTGVLAAPPGLLPDLQAVPAR